MGLSRKTFLGQAVWLVSLGLLLAACRDAAAGEKQPGDPRVARLIEQLGDRQYAVRQHAQSELARMGFAVFDPLSAAAQNADLEIASRARYLLGRLRLQNADAKDSPRVRKILADYEMHPPEVRAYKIRQLAWLSDLAGVPALCRLVRYERSLSLSSYAEAALLNREPADQATWTRWAQLLREHLTESTRPAAGWLLGYLRAREDAPGAVADWTRLVEAEYQRVRSSPDSAGVSVAVPMLYALAQIDKQHGNRDQAEQSARRARELLPSAEDERLEIRGDAAASLQHRGLLDWAEQEYRGMIAAQSPMYNLLGTRGLSEMFYDQGKNKEASEVCRAGLEALRNALKQGHLLASEDFGPNLKSMQARMSYFLACDWEARGDRAQQLQCLQQALIADPGEVDALIASYRFPDPPAALRQKVRAALRGKIARLRDDIARNPEDDEQRNQLAWLVANTEGDLDEALRAANRALELSPNNGAYLDTLAHVYFAKGNLAGAVKYQAKAVEFEPHSGQIARKLKVFREALERK